MKKGCLWWTLIGWWWSPINGIISVVKKTGRNEISRRELNNSDALLDEMFPETKRQMDLIDKHNGMLTRLADAKLDYKQDGDLDKLISIYEAFFIDAKPYLKSSQEIDLADLYIKAGQNDKAWRYLNLLLQRNETPKHKIYSQQARILKKEGKYTDAVRAYMFCHLDKSQLGDRFIPEPFRKDIQSSVNKLKWDERMIKTLSDIIEEQVRAKNYREWDLSEKYKQALAEFEKWN